MTVDISRKRKLKISLTIFTIIVVVSASIFWFYHFFANNNVSFLDQNDIHTESLFAIKTTDPAAKTNIYRLEDLKHNALDNDWQITFSAGDEIIGILKQKSAADEGSLFVINKRVGKIIKSKAGFGQIIAATQNPLRTYFLLKVIGTDNKTFFCVLNREDKTTEACQKLPETVLEVKDFDSADIYDVYWNYAKDRQIIIENKTTNKLYTYDPWDTLAISADLNSDAIEKNREEPKTSFALKKIGPLLIAQNETYRKQLSFFLIGFDQKPLFLTPDSILLLSKNQVQIINLKSRQKSYLFSLDTLSATLMTSFGAVTSP